MNWKWAELLHQKHIAVERTALCCPVNKVNKQQYLQSNRCIPTLNKHSQHFDYIQTVYVCVFNIFFFDDEKQNSNLANSYRFLGSFLLSNFQIKQIN